MVQLLWQLPAPLLPFLVRLQLQNVGIKSQGSLIYLAGQQRIKEAASDPVLGAVVCPAQAAASFLPQFQPYRMDPEAAFCRCVLLLGILFTLTEWIVCPSLYPKLQQCNFLRVISHVCNRDRKQN